MDSDSSYPQNPINILKTWTTRVTAKSTSKPKNSNKITPLPKLSSTMSPPPPLSLPTRRELFLRRALLPLFINQIKTILITGAAVIRIK